MTQILWLLFNIFMIWLFALFVLAMIVIMFEATKEFWGMFKIFIQLLKGYIQ